MTAATGVLVFKVLTRSLTFTLSLFDFAYKLCHCLFVCLYRHVYLFIEGDF